jgi:hypothetical protein
MRRPEFAVVAVPAARYKLAVLPLFDEEFRLYMSAWCTDRKCRRKDPNPDSGSDHADIARPSQFQHAVECMDSYFHLSRPTLVDART